MLRGLMASGLKSSAFGVAPNSLVSGVLGLGDLAGYL